MFQAAIASPALQPQLGAHRKPAGLCSSPAARLHNSNRLASDQRVSLLPSPASPPSRECQVQKARQLCRATGTGGGGSGDGAPEPAAAAAQLVASPFYRIWLQLGVVLLLLMLVDAGYSGDWSRIGAITKEQEGQLQQVAVAVGCFHLACGAVAAAVSSRRGESWLPRTAKVLAVGFLALLEVVLLPEEGHPKQP